MEGRGDLDLAISVVRGHIEEQFRISERLDSKARQAFTLAAAFFAVVQAVTFGAFGQAGVNSAERVVMLVAALVAGLALAATAHRLAESEEPREEETFRPQRVAQWWEEAGDDDQYVAKHTLVALVRIAESRSESNDARERLRGRTATTARLAMVLTGAELLLALAIRI